MKSRAVMLAIFLVLPHLPHLASPRSATAQSRSPADSLAQTCDRAARVRVTELSGAVPAFVRVTELMGAGPLRPGVIRRPSGEPVVEICGDDAGVPWVSERGWIPRGGAEGSGLVLLPVRWRSEMSSAYPNDRNNGALWTGRGVSTAVAGGLAIRWRILSAALRPELVYHQNRVFDFVAAGTPDHSPYIYSGHPGSIDWPHRFGEGSFWTADPGQSYIRVDAGRLAAGVSTENLWWGPAHRNPLLLSNTAPGFPHLFLGSARPLDVGIGRIEAQAVWGRLSESDYFDYAPENDYRLFSGLILDFEPRRIPGLFVGLARVHVQAIPPEGLGITETLLGAYMDPRTNPQDLAAGDNQLVSAFARWALPRGGFETWVEWAREDHWADIDELIAVPDASQAYTLGFRKVIPSGSNWVSITGELTHLEDALPILHAHRQVLTFYTHIQVTQGYTHRGQLLGAAIGPGSDSQFLEVELFTASGRLGAFLERVRHDGDAYNARWARTYGARGHDLELSAGVHQLLFLRHFDVDWALAYSRRYNRNFLGLDGESRAPRIDNNLSLQLGLTWRPGREIVTPPSAMPAGTDR